MLADRLRQSSDDLTRMARSYVVTGNPVYKTYFNEILSIRDGKSPRPHHYEKIYWNLVTSTTSGKRPTSYGQSVSLMDLMKQAGFSTVELDKLSQAKAKSDQLAELENRAFAALEGRFPDEAGNLTVSGPPDPELARKILFSREYHEVKGEIVKPIGEFLELLETRTLSEVQLVRNRERLYEKVAGAMVFLTIVVSILAFFHMRRQDDQTHCFANRNRPPHRRGRL